MRAIDTIDSELQLVAALRRAARERGGPPPSMDLADARLVTGTVNRCFRFVEWIVNGRSHFAVGTGPAVQCFRHG